MLYRGQDLVKKLGNKLIVVCGGGALGSNLIENLARQGFSNLRVIDMDRVEEHNLNTQTFDVSDIGAKKTAAIQNRIYRAVGVDVDAVDKEMTSGNIKKFLKGAGLVVDVFDNTKSRQMIQDYVRKNDIPCLHAGVNADYGEVVWDDRYTVPNANQEGDVCDYPLARNLSMFIVMITSEEIINFCMGEGVRASHSFTLKDLKIGSYQ